MVAEPDYPAFLAGLQTLTAQVGAGSSGLPALRTLVTAAAGGLGAAGMTLTSLAPTGRVIVATGVTGWAAGRPVPAECDRIAVGVDDDDTAADTWEVAVEDLPEEFSAQLVAGGIGRLLGARIGPAEQPLGGIHAYFATPAPPLGPGHHTLLGCAAGLAAQWADPPAPAPAQPATAAFDRDLFIAVTSHELRTPVTVIKGFVDTLSHHWAAMDEPRRREAISVIGQRTDDLARLVDRLLAAATATDPAGVPICARFDLVDALHEAAAELSPELRRRLAVALPATGLPAVSGDRASLATVLTELVTNAVKYSDDEVVLTAAADRHTVMFQVADRGHGIAPEHVERAFERYWQARPSDSGADAGAGLGLYLVRQIVERQKGWVSLRPRLSGGTVAEVRLPRAAITGQDRC